ncbi:hypothetical protein FRC01_007024 [Tulasnella sp. 417]|nr:hypothetical protein FRC01_007024 [Tulasnella sp. 417]
MPATFWWDILGPSKQDLDHGTSGAVQVLVVMPGGRRVIFEPAAKAYFTTCGRWNDSLPVHRLPPELLSHIFLLAITPRDLERDPSGHALARVCSFWRAVILDTPAFWTTLSNISSPDAVRLKIRRSRSSRLNFVYSEQHGPREPFLNRWEFMRAIGAHTLRCNSFRIRVSNWYRYRHWIEKNFQGSYIPRLIMESPDGSIRAISGSAIPRRVQNVCLENIDILWEPGSLPQLVSLQIIESIGTFSRSDWDVSSTFSAVTDMLEACPCLKTLKLGPFKDGFRAHVNDAGMKNETVSFDSLECLEMKGSPSELFWEVLDRIKFPSLSKLVIHPSDLNPSDGKLKNVVSKTIRGQSLLQSVIDRANCNRLAVFVRREHPARIMVQGINDTGMVIDLDPLTRDPSEKAVLTVLRAVNIPVNIEVSGDADGSFIRSLKEAAITTGCIPKGTEVDKWHFTPC